MLSGLRSHLVFKLESSCCFRSLSDEILMMNEDESMVEVEWVVGNGIKVERAFETGEL